MKEVGMMNELTLLTRKEISTDKLEVLEKYGIRALITDLAILTGGGYNDGNYIEEDNYANDNKLKYRPCCYSVDTQENSKYYAVGANGSTGPFKTNNIRAATIRPVLRTPFIFSLISSNTTKCYNNIEEVEYLEYPQNAVDKDIQTVLEKDYQNRNLQKTGNYYTFDRTDGNDENQEFQPTKYNEYKYNGKKYIRVKANPYVDDFTLSNGVNYHKGDFVWVEVSPVKWLVDRKSKILISKAGILSGIKVTNITKYLNHIMNRELFQNIELIYLPLDILLDELKKKFIGQEDATEDIFYNIINNQFLAELKELPDGQRSIIFLDGPTGTGKTAIVREITEKLGIPFTSTSITNYSGTGYVGDNIVDNLKNLYTNANGDIKLAQRGIIVLDEFDKLAYTGNNDLEMKKAVQQQLLNFLGGGKYIIDIEENETKKNKIEFDTSKLTFVCLGALTNLRFQKTVHNPIGFAQPIPLKNKINYTITPQDLIDLGLERELVGRFNTYIHTNDYSKEQLVKILKESTISPLIGFKNWIESNQKKLIIDEDVYELIATQAYQLNTGARSLQTIMNNIRTLYIKDVLRGTNKIIYLDSKTVLKIYDKVITRKARR